jgi:hypothetical protein
MRAVAVEVQVILPLEQVEREVLAAVEEEEVL